MAERRAAVIYCVRPDSLGRCVSSKNFSYLRMGGPDIGAPPIMAPRVALPILKAFFGARAHGGKAAAQRAVRL